MDVRPSPRLLVIAAVLAAGASSCESLRREDALRTAPGFAHVEPAGEVPVDLLEVLFRHTLERNAGRAGAHYFLSLGYDRDPPAELLARFAGHEPEVLPVSAAQRPGLAARHARTGARGLHIAIDGVEWIGGGRARAVGRYLDHGLSGTGHEFVLERTDGVWEVKQERRIWIS